jgi:hypothetical protein
VRVQGCPRPILECSGVAHEAPRYAGPGKTHSTLGPGRCISAFRALGLGGLVLLSTIIFHHAENESMRILPDNVVLGQPASVSRLWRSTSES